MLIGNPYASDPKDVELENEISRHLHNLRDGEFHVTVRGGNVVVSGMVDDFSTKHQVTLDIRGMGGVREITNHLRVTGSAYAEDSSEQNI